MRSLLVIAFALLTTPAFAQSANRIDWSKPVVGVDTPPKPRAEDIYLPVQILTTEEAKALTSVSRATPLPPPCEPPPTARDIKPAGPAPCPAR